MRLRDCQPLGHSQTASELQSLAVPLFGYLLSDFPHPECNLRESRNFCLGHLYGPSTKSKDMVCRRYSLDG